MQRVEEECSMVLEALPFGIHRTPLRDLCNFTEHTGSKAADKLLLFHHKIPFKFYQCLSFMAEPL